MAQRKISYARGAIVRGDTTQKKIAIVFTGDLYADGADQIMKTLKKKGVKASFFLTGNFYRTPSFQSIIKKLKAVGHYLGAHSDKHLLYCDWINRDSLLVTKLEFKTDLLSNYVEMEKFGIHRTDAPYFLPPYEWYNDSISKWTNELGFQLVNFSGGTLSHADYTTPEMKNYKSSAVIFNSIASLEERSSNHLNGFILLLHVGTDPARTDKFYFRLEELIDYLKGKKYAFVTINDLLDH